MHDSLDKNATGVQIFNNPIFGDIRIATTEHGTLFCLADLCKAVSLSNPSNVKSRLDSEDVQLIDLHALSSTEGIGNSRANFVNESGFYDVLLQSSSPNVKPFRKWVTSEVLPAIRKNGGYIAASPEETPEQIMARALIVAQRTIESHKQKLQMLEGEVDVLQTEKKVLAPKAIYTDEVLQSTSTFTLTQVAHDLGFRSVYAFTAWTKEKGLLFYQSGQWQPTANVAGKGYFTTRTARYIKNDNTIGTSISTVVTEKGRMFLHGLRKWGVA
jgi:prophage antirepressor-like protein